MMDDEDLPACIPPAAIINPVFAAKSVAESKNIVVRLEADEMCAVDATIFYLPRAIQRALGCAVVAGSEQNGNANGGYGGG